MAYYAGTGGSVVLVAGGTAAVGEIEEWSLDISTETVSYPAFGRSWDQATPGVSSATGSFSGNADFADAYQGTIIAYQAAGSAIGLHLYVSTAKYWDIGTAYVTGIGNGISQTGKGDISFDFKVSGQPVLT